ncbi:DNA repair protein RecO, partial [Francisella tularensis subsp. holarctica]|nr:DNA repair protein RecO [Francisella tularensis subsp. holarctica]
YDFILRNIDEANYRHLLRMFELEILNSLGQGIYVDSDIDGMLIQNDSNYIILPNGFRKDFSIAVKSISGSSLKKINQPLSS